jgi:hypothetical protein
MSRCAGWPNRGLVALLLVVGASTLSLRARAQPCVLVADKSSPADQILRCGGELEVRPAPGTVYHPAAAAPNDPPASVRLDSGAVLTEFHPSQRRRDFQILTPLAIASVRGTKWAVEAVPERTSVLVLDGAVNVSRVNGPAGVVLRPGEGVDVKPDGEPLTVRRWPAARVAALMARFGR